MDVFDELLDEYVRRLPQFPRRNDYARSLYHPNPPCSATPERRAERAADKAAAKAKKRRRKQGRR